MRNELGNKVRNRMRELGFTYTQTAGDAQISRDYLAKIIQGARNPMEMTIVRLADALRFNRRDLLKVAYQSRLPAELRGLEFLQDTQSCECPAILCRLFSLIKTRIRLRSPFPAAIKLGNSCDQEKEDRTRE